MRHRPAGAGAARARATPDSGLCPIASPAKVRGRGGGTGSAGKARTDEHVRASCSWFVPQTLFLFFSYRPAHPRTTSCVQQRGASSTSIGPASESRAPKLLHCGLGLLLHHAGKRPFRAPMHTRLGGRSRACPSLSCVCVCVCLYIVEPRQLLPRAWCYRCPRRYLSINKTLSRSTFSSVDAPRRLGLRAGQTDGWTVAPGVGAPDDRDESLGAAVVQHGSCAIASSPPSISIVEPQS